MRKTDYLKIGFSPDIDNLRDRRIFRLLEILPGALSWGTILLVIFLSWQRPAWIAVFIICFDIYWLLKTLYLSFHQQASFKKMKKNLKIDWLKKLDELPVTKWRDIYHLVILPMYKEGLEVVRPTFQALIGSKYPLDRLIVVLAVEERVGEPALQIAKAIKEEFGDKFFRLLITIHPKSLRGELAGKGSNET